MNYRMAQLTDIAQIQRIRGAVKENKLSNPALVTDEDCANYLTRRGRGWVCEDGDQLLGFAIADLEDNNIWALFIDPEQEGRGIGRQLQRLMLEWYFQQQKDSVWLSTAPGTRAEQFYRKSGWTPNGTHGKGEIRFEMTREAWLLNREKE